MELFWKTSVSASCFHAVAALVDGRPLIDPGWQAAIAEKVDTLRRLLTQFSVPSGRLFGHLVPLAARHEDDAELSDLALVKAIGRHPKLAGLLKQLVTSLEADFRQRFPNAEEQLPLRLGPIREQWEARGPGLLRGVAARTDPDVVAPRAEVVIVQPALGGDGVAHPLYNAVTLEGMLANPQGDLPEVARLAWLLAQLTIDLPKFQGKLTLDRTQRAAAIGLIPIVLQAAETVELARCDRKRIEAAFEAWLPPSLRPANVDLVWAWWETYQSGEPNWPVALAVMDKL